MREAASQRPDIQPEANRFYGWLDDPDQTIPTHEPPRDAPCPYCGIAIRDDDVRTHSLMWKGPVYAKRSYFYRTHRTCDDAKPNAMDGFILDMIERNGD
jgi:hypothetical protein